MQLVQWSLALICTPRRAKFLWVPNTVTHNTVVVLPVYVHLHVWVGWVECNGINLNRFLARAMSCYKCLYMLLSELTAQFYSAFEQMHVECAI